MLSTGVKISRMHTSGSVISCLLVLVKRKSYDMSECPKRKGQVSPLGDPPPEPALILREPPSHPGAGARSLICGAVLGV